jgi:hypothetical protein
MDGFYMDRFHMANCCVSYKKAYKAEIKRYMMIKKNIQLQFRVKLFSA